MTNRLYLVPEMESFFTLMLNKMRRPTDNASIHATMELPMRYLTKVYDNFKIGVIHIFLYCSPSF